MADCQGIMTGWLLSEALNVFCCEQCIVCEREMGVGPANCKGGIDCVSVPSILFDQGVALKRGKWSMIGRLWNEV